jgi:hypothetical protein
MASGAVLDPTGIGPASLSADDPDSLATAVDILYGTLTKELYDQLHEEQPEVEALAQQVHYNLWHAGRTEFRCAECGELMFYDENEVAYHGEDGAVDYDADADHVAINWISYEEACRSIRRPESAAITDSPAMRRKGIKRDPHFMPFGMYFKPIVVKGNPAHQSAWHWWAVWGGISRWLSVRRLNRAIRHSEFITTEREADETHSVSWPDWNFYD